MALHAARGLDDVEELEATLIEVIVATCDLQAKAGFRERAVAAFQAAIEVNAFLSEVYQSYRTLIGEPLAYFEAYWESGAPRIGEPGAVGFARWLELRTHGAATPTVRGQHPATRPDGLDAITDWQKWLQIETFREQTHWQPWRPLGAEETEEDCDDVDRVVLYDDISGLLCRVASERGQVELVLRCLDHIGFSTAARVSSRHPSVANAAMQLTSARGLFDRVAEQLETLALEEQAKLTAQADGLHGISHMASQTATRDDCARVGDVALGDQVSAWGALHSKCRSNSHEQYDAIFHNPARFGWLPSRHRLEPDAFAFARNLLEQMMTVCPGNFDLVRAYLDLLALHDYKTARKTAKKLLKMPHNRASLPLYALFAEIEARAGRTEDAIKVLTTAVDMSGKLAEQTGRSRLIHMLIWLHLHADNKEYLLKSALGLLLSSIPSANSPTLQAKANRRVDELMTEWNKRDVVVSGHEDYAILVFTCAVYVWAQSGDIKRCLSIFDKGVEGLAGSSSEPCSVYLEWLYHQQLSFLLHINQQQALSVAPKQIRSLLSRALDAFPTSPAFWSTLIATESRLRLTGPLRHRIAQCEQHPDTKDSPIFWLMAVAAEVLLPISRASHQRIYRLLNKATSTRARHCVLVWRMYMDFVRTQQGLDGLQSSQDIFYQGVQACPGAKILYMDAASHNPRRLNDLLDILQEKELHLRTPLEELELIEEEGQQNWQGLTELASYSGPLDRQLEAATKTGHPGADGMQSLESRLPDDDEDEDLLAFLPDYDDLEHM
eukprot:TRINITY_DN10447_c0_g1_i1.p1 TRINITY_DN10447_c0_g1~~TRINITY_DN10447_c0_g1_i1.p1  ORF type:complete len:807 (+),score=108.93 TRINITY_DN10447_c0_g1_i1:86-2422(+)